jgi:glycosyltransferase involved in cell wall biosynthesis
LTRPHLVWVNQFAALPADGGGTRHFELGRELVQRGWDVTVVASDYHLQRRAYTRRPDARDRSTIEETVDGVRFRWLWAAPYTRNDWRRALNWLTFHRSVVSMAAMPRRPDVVIGSSPQLLAAAAARRLARRVRAPFVLEVRDLWPESLVAAGGRKGLVYFAFARIASGLYRDARAIIVLAAGAGRYLEGRGVDAARIALVPNGADVHLIQPRSGPPVPADPGAVLSIIYAGAHGPANGMDVVIEAAGALEAARAPVRFILLGDGPDKPALMAAAASRGLSSIEFKEPVPKAELAPMLAGADAGLMTLRDAELFSFAVSPNKLFDYLSAGIPVICNVPGEVAEMLAESGAGIQTSDASAAALAAAVQRLREIPPGDRAQMGREGRRWVEQHHSREVLGARLDTVLRGVLGAV